MIIFGRSPFINQVDVVGLCKRHQTIGFNHFGKHFPIDFLFNINEYNEARFSKTKIIGRNGIDFPVDVEKIEIKPSFEPIIDKTNNYAFYIFSVSTAINWCIKRGYTKIYLVGIDHVETDTRLEHHDGIDDHRGQNLINDFHILIKQFIYNCTKYAEIYQCNPNTKNNWKLPYKAIEEL